MNYYKENGEKIKCDKTKCLGTGSEGYAYKSSSNTTIKIWHNKDDVDFDVFEEFRTLNPPNYYVIDSLLFKRKSDIIDSSKSIGYDYSHIKEEEVNILTMPIDYTLDNLNGLYEANLTLSEHNIMARDLDHFGNIILNKDSITVIDIDSYTRNHSLPLEKLREINLNLLRDIIIDIYLEAFGHYDISFIERLKFQGMAQDLFSLITKKGIQPISKKLKKYRYPIDYFKYNR